MLIPLRYLVDRLRHGPDRAAEVHQLRRQLAAADTSVPPQEAALAAALHQLRERLSRAIGDVTACRSCAAGHPEPHGHFAGGHCCGAGTFDLFNDDEVAALRLSGTTPGRLRPPAGDFAGCAFRGPAGCSLRAADRPNLCVRYVCPDLARELHRLGRLDGVEALAAEMEAVYLRFIELRARRLDQAALAEDAPRAS